MVKVIGRRIMPRLTREILADVEKFYEKVQEKSMGEVSLAVRTKLKISPSDLNLDKPFLILTIISTNLHREDFKDNLSEILKAEISEKLEELKKDSNDKALDFLKDFYAQIIRDSLDKPLPPPALTAEQKEKLDEGIRFTFLLERDMEDLQKIKDPNEYKKNFNKAVVDIEKRFLDRKIKKMQKELGLKQVALAPILTKETAGEPLSKDDNNKKIKLKREVSALEKKLKTDIKKVDDLNSGKISVDALVEQKVNENKGFRVLCHKAEIEFVKRVNPNPEKARDLLRYALMDLAMKFYSSEAVPSADRIEEKMLVFAVAVHDIEMEIIKKSMDPKQACIKSLGEKELQLQHVFKAQKKLLFNSKLDVKEFPTLKTCLFEQKTIQWDVHNIRVEQMKLEALDRSALSGNLDRYSNELVLKKQDILKRMERLAVNQDSEYNFNLAYQAQQETLSELDKMIANVEVEKAKAKDDPKAAIKANIRELEDLKDQKILEWKQKIGEQLDKAEQEVLASPKVKVEKNADVQLLEEEVLRLNLLIDQNKKIEIELLKLDISEQSKKFESYCRAMLPVKSKLKEVIAVIEKRLQGDKGKEMPGFRAQLKTLQENLISYDAAIAANAVELVMLKAGVVDFDTRLLEYQALKIKVSESQEKVKYLTDNVIELNRKFGPLRLAIKECESSGKLLEKDAKEVELTALNLQYSETKKMLEIEKEVLKKRKSEMDVIEQSDLADPLLVFELAEVIGVKKKEDESRIVVLKNEIMENEKSLQSKRFILNNVECMIEANKAFLEKHLCIVGELKDETEEKKALAKTAADIEKEKKVIYEKDLKDNSGLYSTTKIDAKHKSIVYTAEELEKLMAKVLTIAEKKEAYNPDKTIERDAKLDILQKKLHSVFLDRDKNTILGEEPRAGIARILGYDIVGKHQQRIEEQKKLAAEAEKIKQEALAASAKSEVQGGRQRTGSSDEEKSGVDAAFLAKLGGVEAYKLKTLEAELRAEQELRLKAEQSRIRIEAAQRHAEEARVQAEEARMRAEKEAAEQRRLKEEAEKQLKQVGGGTPVRKDRFQ